MLVLGDVAARDLVNHVCHGPWKDNAAGIFDEPLPCGLIEAHSTTEQSAVGP